MIGAVGGAFAVLAGVFAYKHVKKTGRSRRTHAVDPLPATQLNTRGPIVLGTPTHAAPPAGHAADGAVNGTPALHVLGVPAYKATHSFA